MLSLTKKTEYALISLGYLAERPDRTVSAREIAAGFHMPVALVMNILKTLHHAQWLASTRGAKGGYRLSIDLHRASIHDLIVVLEGPVRLTECVTLDGECPDPTCCKIGGTCPIRQPVNALHQRLVGVLKDTKVADLFRAPAFSVCASADVAIPVLSI